MHERQTQPVDPVAAVTHADPYPYYARLVEERPLYHDEQLGCWVASSAEARRAETTTGLPPIRTAPTA